jgi:hypothetical protein
MIHTMKLINIIPALLFIAQTSAHSWVGCTAHDNTDILEWMKVSQSLLHTYIKNSIDMLTCTQ